MFNKKKKIKEKKSIQDKAFVRFSRVYPECNVIELRNGIYLKMFRIIDEIKESSCEKYNEVISEHFKYGNQFFYFQGETYVVIMVEADYIDDAVMKFSEIIFDYSEMVQGFELEEVGIKEWLDMISQMTQFRTFDDEVWQKAIESMEDTKSKKKSKLSLIQTLQPWDRKTKDDYLEIGKKISKTVMLTNYPARVFSGLMTEIMEISDTIVGSLYIRAVDSEKCIAAMDMTADKSTQREVMRKHLEKNLYQCCLFLSISGYEGEVDRIYKKIEELTGKYLSGINNLEHQQNQAFLSVLPLCDNFVRYNKVLTEESAVGLFNYSWVKRLHSGLKYGKSNISGKEIYYNRLLENSSGFFLGSDYEEVKKRTKYEIKQIQEIAPEKKIAVFTLGGVNSKSDSFVDISSCRVLGDDLAVNRELLRALYYMVNGVTGNVSKNHQKAIDSVLSDEWNVQNYDNFLSALRKVNPLAAERMGAANIRNVMTSDEICKQTGSLGVYKALSSTSVERTIRMMGSIAQCDADVIYILNGEAIARLDNNDFINLVMDRKNQMITVIGTDGMAMYRNQQFKKAMKNSDFIHISKCEILEKVNLINVLNLSKEQAGYVSEDGHDVLITKYAEYLIDERENEE